MDTHPPTWLSIIDIIILGFGSAWSLIGSFVFFLKTFFEKDEPEKKEEEK
jgi:hypothetical protein